jgi:hypothetical protein
MTPTQPNRLVRATTLLDRVATYGLDPQMLQRIRSFLAEPMTAEDWKAIEPEISAAERLRDVRRDEGVK